MSTARILCVKLGIGLAVLSRAALAQNDNPTGPAGAFNGYSTTAGEFDPYTGNATRTVTDLVVPGSMGAYPLVWQRTMNSRHVAGANYDFGEAGSWQHSYNWGADAAVGNTNVPTSYTISYPDGRVVVFAPRTSATVDSNYRGPAGVADRFQPVAGNGYCYLLLADGGQVQFLQTAQESVEQGIPPKPLVPVWDFTLTPTVIIDPHGLRTQLRFNGPQGQLSYVSEPAGHWLQINYGASSTPGVYVITSVQAGNIANTITQSVTYSYSTFSVSGYSYTTLTGVTYSDGTSASYTYQAANTYPNTGPPLIQTCNDVRYPGPMKKIAYTFTAQPSESAGGIYGEFSNAAQWLSPAPVAVRYSLQNHYEHRGDGPARTFYFGANPSRPQYVVPQPYLLSQYTDFKGNSSYLGYDQNTYVSAFEDANGNVTNFTRTFTGKPLTIVHPPDATGVRSSIQFTYTDGTSTNQFVTGTGSNSATAPDAVYGYFLQSVTDELGHPTIYQRDGNNRVKEIDYPDTGSETFTYNIYGELLTHKMTSGGTESYQYDSYGRMASYRDPYHDPIGLTGKPTFWYQYDSLDRVSGQTDSRGSGPGDASYTTNYAYNQRGQVTTLTHPVDATTGQRYTVINAYNDDSTLQSTTDERGNTTSYGYDDYKRLTSVSPPVAYVGDTNPRTTNYYYDHTGGTATDYTHTDANVWLLMKPSGHTVLTQYDENFRKRAVTIGNGSEAATTSYTYDLVGNLKTVAYPETAAQGFTTYTYYYDSRNRLTDIDDVYGDANRLRHQTSWTYDQAGNKKSQLRANNQLITFDQYDAMNRLQVESIQRDTNTVDQLTFAYDTAGNLSTYVDAKQKIYSYAYDLMNRRAMVTYPKDDSGTMRTEQYRYDLANNLNQYITRSGAVESLTYDNRNRVIHSQWSDGTTERYISYDPVGNVVNIHPGTEDLGYDFRNRLISSKHTDDGLGVARTVSYTYDADSNRLTMTYPSGLVLTYGYDTRDELHTISDGSGTIATYAYDGDGQVRTRSLRNGTTSTYYFDLLHTPSEVRHDRGTSEFGYDFYAVDGVGQIYWHQHEDGYGEYYSYYLDGQLQTARFNATAISDSNPQNNTSFSYDANGNRTTTTSKSTTSYSYTVNDLNEYTAVNSAGASYNANGALASYSGSTYYYNAHSQLTNVRGPACVYDFYYDGLERQTLRYDNGSWIYSIWDGWNLLEEYDQNGTVLHTYVHGAGIDEMIERTGGGQTIWFYPDEQGNTTHITDDTGNVLEKYKYDAALGGAPSIYDPTGQARAQSAYDNRFLFSGRDWLKQARIYDYRNRFYLPSLARFLQPDPIEFRGDPRNLYRSFANDPINRSDPLGLNVTVYEYPDSITVPSGIPLTPGVQLDYNHVGLSVNGAPSWGYYPAVSSPIYSGDVRIDQGTPIAGRSVNIPTTPQQEAQINNYIEQVRSNPGTYTFPDNNCTNFVEDCLRAGNIANVPNTVVPGKLIDQLQRAYPPGTVPVVPQDIAFGDAVSGEGGGLSLDGESPFTFGIRINAGYTIFYVIVDGVPYIDSVEANQATHTSGG